MRTGTLPGDLYVPNELAALRERLEALGEQDGTLLDVIAACGTYTPEERVRDGGGLRAALDATWGAVAERRLEPPTEGRERGTAASTDAPPTPRPSMVAAPEPSVRAGNGLVVALAGIAAVAAVVAAVGSFRQQGSGGVAVEGPEGEEELPWCDVSARGFAGVQAPGPRETQAVAAADVDGDGAIDALYTNQLDESVTIWWGRDGRAPGDRMDVATGRSGYPPVVHDFDRDGQRDLLLSLSDDSAFSLVRGLGGRRFAPPERIMQGPAPRETQLVPSRSGPALMFAGPQLAYRMVPADGRWQPHVTISDLPALARMAVVRTTLGVKVAVFFPSAYVLSLDEDLLIRERVEQPTWPPVHRAFSADLQPGADEELYGVVADGRVVRLPLVEGDTPCVVSEAHGIQPIATLAHLDGDGVPDLVAADTCAECTSSHVVRYGQGE
jgi:hypothetical protein